jgi:MFS family permease
LGNSLSCNQRNAWHRGSSFTLLRRRWQGHPMGDVLFFPPYDSAVPHPVDIVPSQNFVLALVIKAKYPLVILRQPLRHRNPLAADMIVGCKGYTVGKEVVGNAHKAIHAGAGVVLSVAMIIAACNGFLTAWISKLCGNRRCGILRFCGFGSFAGVFILFCTVLFNIKLWYVDAGGWILMAFAGNCSAISVALFRESNRDEDLGTATSGSNFFAYLVIAVLGGVAGILMEISPPTVVDGIKIYGRFSYLPVFLLLLVLTAGAALASALLKESYGKNISDKVK